jgi:hypothetical protein
MEQKEKWVKKFDEMFENWVGKDNRGHLLTVKSFIRTLLEEEGIQAEQLGIVSSVKLEDKIKSQCADELEEAYKMPDQYCMADAVDNLIKKWRG